MKKTDQRSRTHFLGKYGGLSLYYIGLNNRYKINHEYIQILNKYGYNLIGNPDHPDGPSMDQKYFFIHDDLFGQILATNHNINISLKIIPKYVSLSSTNDIITD